MSATLQQDQQPMDGEIVNSIIASIPVDWTSAVLTLERSKEAAGVGDFSHILTSGDGRRTAIPETSLYDATFRLDEVFRRHGAFLTRAVYRTEERPDGQWKYVANYQHDKLAA
jgi:hypothetical protein